jgi:DNA replication initiation complex subunit (GINS family)
MSGRSVDSEGIPKALSRVLDAERIQKIYHERKRAAQQDGDDGSTPTKQKKRKLDPKADPSKKNLTSTGVKMTTEDNMQIKPGESLAHFNRYLLLMISIFLFH